MSFGDNKLSPLQIEDARAAAYRASELQQQVEKDLKESGDRLAEAERVYRIELLSVMKDMHDKLKVGWSTCEVMAKGDEKVSNLRKARDEAQFEVKIIEQQAYRRAADRKDLNLLLGWSEARDLRTDAPPPAGAVSTIGGRRAA